MALPTIIKSLLHNTIQDVELPNGRKVLALHTPEVILDTNGNGDDVFNASNIEQSPRAPDHGYEPGQDEEAGNILNVGDVQDKAERARAAMLAKTIERWRGTFANNAED